MVPRPDDPRVAGPRRVVPAHLVQDPLFLFVIEFCAVISSPPSLTVKF